MSEAFMGQIVLFAGNFAPRNWMFCAGQILPINQNTALFAILGTSYGGNGSTTFGLPDLRSRVPVGAGQGTGLSAYSLGQLGGTESVTLNSQQMPSHTHTLFAANTPGGTTDPTEAFLSTANDGNGVNTPSYNATLSPQVSMGQGSISSTGGSQPHDNLQPYQALNYIICVQGIFPVRS